MFAVRCKEDWSHFFLVQVLRRDVKNTAQMNVQCSLKVCSYMLDSGLKVTWLSTN